MNMRTSMLHPSDLAAREDGVLAGSRVSVRTPGPMTDTNRNEVPPNMEIQNDGTIQPLKGDVLPPIPVGQNINVVTNQNVHLPFKDWLLRGILGSIGRAFAFPFSLVGSLIASIAQGVVSIIKIAAIVVLFPTLIWLGFQLQQKMSEQESVESGASELVNQAESVAKGVSRGITEGKPEEKPAK